MEGTGSSNSRHSRSYSSNQTQNWVDAYCGCGVKAHLRTSNTNANPGRRFLGCVNYEEENGCKFFIWVDPPTCPRGVHYGRQLQNKIKELQKEEGELRRLNEFLEMDKEKMMKKMDKLFRMNHELKKKNEVLWKWIAVCVFVIGVFEVPCLGNRKATYGGMFYLP